MNSKQLTRTVSYAVLYLWSLIVLFPLYWMFSTAFKESLDIFPIPKYIPWLQFEPTLHAFQVVFTDFREPVVNAFMNSLIASVGSAIAATALGALAGYALVRFHYRVGPMRNDDVAFWFVSQRMLPPVAVVFPFIIMYRALGLLDTKIGLIIAYTVFNLPLAVWIMRDAFRAVPLEIEESALIDGCSRFGAFFRVSLPIAMPGVVTSLIICLIFAWNEFIFALMLTFQRAQTLPLMIASQVNEQGAQWWTMSVMSLVAVAPIIIIWFTLDRWIVGGLSAGAVK